VQTKPGRFQRQELAINIDPELSSLPYLHPDMAPIPSEPGRRWPRFLAVSAILCAILGIASFDESAPEVGDLAPTPRVMPDDQNAYLVLEKAAWMFPWTSSNPGVDCYDDKPISAKSARAFYSMEDGKGWDAAQAEFWCKPMAKSWPLLAKAAALEFGQAPPTKEVGREFLQTIAALEDQPDSFERLFRVSILHGWELYHTGQAKAAMDWMLTNLNAAQKLEESRGGLRNYPTGVFVRDILESAIVAMATRPESPPTATRRAMLALERRRPDIHETAENFRAIFQSLAATVAAVPEWKTDLSDYGPSVRYGVHVPLFFKVHQSQRLLADYAREAIGLINANGGEVEAWLNRERARKTPSSFAVPIPAALFDEILVGHMRNTWDNLLKLHLEERCRDAATAAALALGLYHRDHGNLPITLSQLVPDYLPAVPLDYYDGQPIRYSRDYLAVWSVGNDGADVTSANPDPKTARLPEVYYRLDFAAPPRPVPHAEAAPSPP